MIVKNVNDVKEELAHSGTCSTRSIFTKEFQSPTLFFAETYVEPKVEIEPHTHKEEEEVYYILEGKGLMKVDGDEREVGPGDTILTLKGSTHSIKNIGNVRLRMVVFTTKC